jgi:hypothetical protein
VAALDVLIDGIGALLGLTAVVAAGRSRDAARTLPAVLLSTRHPSAPGDD